MKTNLFKKIWLKAFKNNASPEVLASDLGDLRGKVKITQYNPYNNDVINVRYENNTLVNQSKTTLIRLISQGQSRWAGTIDPEDYKISKMRFSNNNPSGQASKLLYYKIDEPSSRLCTPPSGDIHAGGGPNPTIGTDALSTINYNVANVAGNYVSGTTENLKIYTLRSSNTSGVALTDSPPSHSTFRIEFRVGTSVIETLYFYNPLDLTQQFIYSRAAINPYKIVTNGLDTNKRITAPNDRIVSSGNQEKIISESDGALTFLYYDYNTSQWKLQIEEITGANGVYDNIRFVFERGKYNIINSIVPRDGYNVGNGNSIALRYSGNTAGDAYPVVSGLEYRDSDADYVDDYSVTFSINMSGQYGNGVTTSGELIKYKEAYLFNNRDEMFSALYLTSPFEKNSLTAFYISWSILSPVS